MSWLYMLDAFVTGSVFAMIALIIVEVIARLFCDAKQTLVGEYDPARDGDFDYSITTNNQKGN